MHPAGNFAAFPSKSHRATIDVLRPASHGRSHAVGTGIPRRVEQRVQGPRVSWSIGVKLGRCLKGSEISIQ